MHLFTCARRVHVWISYVPGNPCQFGGVIKLVALLPYSKKVLGLLGSWVAPCHFCMDFECSLCRYNIDVFLTHFIVYFVLLCGVKQTLYSVCFNCVFLHRMPFLTQLYLYLVCNQYCDSLVYS